MKKTFRVLVPLLLVIAIIASIGWYLFVYDRDFTRDILLSQARYSNTRGDTKLASWFYDLAYEHTGQDPNVAIELANQYKAVGNYTKAEFTLSNAIADSGGTVELYTALSKTFVEQDKLLDAVRLLDSIPNAQIKTKIDTLRPTVPVPNRPAASKDDPDAGLYNEYFGVTLHATTGTVYYSTDGSYPSTSGAVFASPIQLGSGVTELKAICVSDSGLVSRLAVYEYTIGGVIEVVEFRDAAIEASVRQLLGMDADDDIYTDTLWTITEFTLPAEASDPGDLAHLSRLEKLIIQDKELNNLDFLSETESLKQLDLSGCRFPASSLSVLSELPNLEHLSLAKCGLSTISALEGARRINYLDVSGNTLRNLEVLSDMTTLVELNLAHNAVVDLAQLSGLINLTTLDVSYNSIQTIEPITACTNLTWLNLNNNSLVSLDGADNLKMLTHLSADHNALSGVAVLAACTDLTELSIAYNKISNISALSDLTKLEIFDFSHNQIKALPLWSAECALRTIDGTNNQLSTIDSLAKLPNLTYVYMDYNKLTNVNALANCYHLVQVNVFGNPIKDVSALTKDAEGNDRGIIVNYGSIED